VPLLLTLDGDAVAGGLRMVGVVEVLAVHALGGEGVVLQVIDDDVVQLARRFAGDIAWVL
jgi:hypothetical protein